MKKYILFPLLFALFISCAKKKTADSDFEEIQKAQKELYSHEEKLFGENRDVKAIKTLASLCESFAYTYPDDKRASTMLFESAKLQNGFLNDPMKAIDLYQKIVDKYPQSREAPFSQFMIGLIYEDLLQLLGKAKDAYEKCVQLYPDHDVARDAKVAIQYLGIPLDSLPYLPKE